MFFTLESFPCLCMSLIYNSWFIHDYIQTQPTHFYVYVGSYHCVCNSSYNGSRCERYVPRQSPCHIGQLYVPYPSRERNEEPGERESETSEINEDVCFASENVATLYFDGELMSTLRKAGVNDLNDTIIAAMKIDVEDWLKKVIQVWYVYADSFNEKGLYNLSDVSILNDVRIHSHNISNSGNISMSVVARVDRRPLSKIGFLCSLNHSYPLKNCLRKQNYSDYTSKDFSFVYYLCPTLKHINTLKQTRRLHCESRETAASKLSGKGGSELPEWSIYLLACFGAALFLFVLMFACYADRSQKLNLQQALRNRQQYDHVRLPEEDDEHYRDVMFRHHISTIGKSAINPVYDNDDETRMIRNPLYGMPCPAESSGTTDARSFKNPLYDTLEFEPGVRAKAKNDGNPT